MANAEDLVPSDFIDIVACLKGESCDFVIVGAHALAVHGSPRATGDLDIFIRPTADNAKRVLRALLRFGAPVIQHGLSERDFATAGLIYQIGVPPVRIDLITEISGVTFEEAARDVVTGHLGSEEARFLGLDAMITNKRASGRTKDIADLEVLEEIRTSRRR